MKKQTRLLIFSGTLLMILPLMVTHFYPASDSISDFVRGFGVALIISSLFVEKKLRKKANSPEG